MFDCSNVEMRDLLPDLVTGLLDAPTRARVEQHLQTCAECASELETLRLVRAAFASAPAVDTRRIAAALPKPPARTRVSTASTTPVRRWMDWRVAAALTMITVGGLSVAVSVRRPGSGPGAVDVPDSVITSVDTQPPGRAPTPPVASPNPDDSGNSSPRRDNPSRRDVRVQLSVGGGVNDLDDASLRALMGALDEIDKAPVAPSTEPDRASVLPVIRESDR